MEDLNHWEFFNFPLPESKIASRPLWHGEAKGVRGQSKLLHAKYNNAEIEITDLNFKDILSVLKESDLLIFNNTKVLNARFKILNQENKEFEILLCSSDSEDFSKWLVLAKPMKSVLKAGKIDLSNSLVAEILGKDESSRFLEIQLSKKNVDDHRSLLEIIDEEGMTPIPPYIRSGNSDYADREEYQTVFASEIGSIAAPTASLHFSHEIISDLKNKGVDFEYLTLHVGPASFLPVNDPLNHKPFPEMYSVSQNVWEKIQFAKQNQTRVIAVGTTVIRSLESFALLDSQQLNFDKFIKTDLFIQPGYQFKVVDSCFTNFHQPKSTHLLLIAALIGKKNLEKLYSHALKENYRFLSYGDSSFLEKCNEF